MFKKLSLREEGQGLVEYALILVLVAVVVIAVLLLLGPAVNQAFCKVANVLKPGTCGVITSVSVNPVENAGNYNVTIEVVVSEATTVTVTLSSGSSDSQSCDTSSSCQFVFNDVPSSSYTIKASDGSQVNGSF